MIITRTPLRITLGGGGTDLPSFYQSHEGFVLTVAIDKYIYIGLHRTFEEKLIAKYSQMEIVEHLEQLRHPIIRETLSFTETPITHLELTSLADVPARTGLGSSGTFTVGLLHALHLYNKKMFSTRDLAEQACHIEIERLNEPVGKQDQYIAAYGGLKCLSIDKTGKVDVQSLAVNEEIVNRLDENLLLFFTGTTRTSSSILSEQKQRSLANDKAMIDSLSYIKELGFASKAAIVQGDLEQFAKIMNTHWQYKKKRSKTMTAEVIESLYEYGLKHGALGGKLVGAGGGGFLLFYTENPKLLRQAMQQKNILEVPFCFESQGSAVLVNP